MAKRKIKTVLKKIDAHVLVPKHSKLSKDETKKLFEHYSITHKELPKILKNDPALANLSVEVGDVIKIMRISPTAGEVTFFRSVTNE